MATVRLNTNLINDWHSFHQLCKEEFGFPDFYGMNMNAWIDCLSYIDDDGDVMSRFNLKKDEMLCIEVTNTKDFNLRLPDIFDALIDASAFVNGRYKSPVLALVFL